MSRQQQQDVFVLTGVRDRTRLHRVRAAVGESVRAAQVQQLSRALFYSDPRLCGSAARRLLSDAPQQYLSLRSGEGFCALLFVLLTMSPVFAEG